MLTLGEEVGRALNKTNAASQVVWTNGYNANGWLTAHWTPAKLLTQYAYDAMGNLTNIDYPASVDVALAYDANNRLTTLVDAAGTSSYDELDRLTNGVILSGSFLAWTTNAYDAASRLATVGDDRIQWGQIGWVGRQRSE